MENRLTTDDLFHILSHSYRRQILVSFLEQNSQCNRAQAPINIVSDEMDLEMLETELVHTHLPKLEDMGYIRWNRDTNEINKGPNYEQIEPLLELLYEHQNKLPIVQL